ncbi:hypothetical protein U14_03313 [Candidatus Moduliflexus flocculans]|uniref:MrpA C-terminal/MbhE domain-containing protein n=1 Tax=Candidatus Moduliflexus flocculans TaxID=1499966 RepID=A0A081BNV0_9BACT|nr:hypothetical protein U14_03313 [Candidatus Moduliflexus flocculans]
MKWLSHGIIGVTLLFFGALLFRVIAFQTMPSAAADYFFQRGIADTGAINIVTAIYLGYRAFDTLGETIVLMLAVSGVVWLIGKKS